MHDWAVPTAGAPSLAARRGDGFLTTPFSERCASLVDAGHHVFRGITPGTGYFSEDRLLALLPRVAARFPRVEIARPDTCTYLGRGPEPRHARAHRDVRQAANRISRAVTTARISPERLRVAQFSDFYATPAHHAALERVTRAHREQPAFHATRPRMVTGVLRATTPADRPLSADQLTAGAEYLDRELPFLPDTPVILGIPASVFAHRAPRSPDSSTARTRRSRPRAPRDSSPWSLSRSHGPHPGPAPPNRFRQARCPTEHPHPRMELTS